MGVAGLAIVASPAFICATDFNAPLHAESNTFRSAEKACNRGNGNRLTVTGVDCREGLVRSLYLTFSRRATP